MSGDLRRPWCCVEPRCTAIHQLANRSDLSDARPGDSFACFGIMPQQIVFTYDGDRHENDLRSCVYTPLKGMVAWQENANDWAMMRDAYTAALAKLEDGSPGRAHPPEPDNLCGCGAPTNPRYGCVVCGGTGEVPSGIGSHSGERRVTTTRILVGDVLDRLSEIPESSIHCVVTSPPYWGLRDYGVEGQIGLEATPEEYVERMVAVFREVRRVLRDDGTLWLNLGDSYAGARRGPEGDLSTLQGSRSSQAESRRAQRAMTASRRRDDHPSPRSDVDVAGLKPKDMIGMPWRVARALQLPDLQCVGCEKEAPGVLWGRQPSRGGLICPTCYCSTGNRVVRPGWWLRSCIVWAKRSCMPESVADRPTTAHEFIFLLTKSPAYFYDADAIREPVSGTAHARGSGVNPKARANGANVKGQRIKQNESFSAAVSGLVSSRNARTVWTINSQAFPEAHFATFPEELPKRCIKAGTSDRGCCPGCGAPWEREVERSGAPEKLEFPRFGGHPTTEVGRMSRCPDRDHRTTRSTSARSSSCTAPAGA